MKRWLKRQRRFHLHFTPTSSSWLNLVERWFGEITRKRIRRGSFKSVKELIEAINQYIRHNNENPKPFVWTKRVDQTLEKSTVVKLRLLQHTSILPITSVIGSDLNQTFTREETLISETTLVVEYGSDLVDWTPVTVGPTSSWPDGNGVTVSITTAVTPDAVSVNIPTSNAVGGKLFARLKVTRLP